MDDNRETYIIPHKGKICKQERRRKIGHRSMVIWFTGLSGSGKSTLAYALEQQLFAKGYKSYVLDGDNIRSGLNRGLGFSKGDREENIRRIGEVSKLFVDSGTIVMSAFVSPYKKDRSRVREILDEREFVEVYVKCPLEVCEGRDPKGLYKKAREGKIPQFTGIDDPYEEPERPELVIETDKAGLGECVGTIIGFLQENGYLEAEE
jgi:adenylylsulfate kinase